MKSSSPLRPLGLLLAVAIVLVLVIYRSRVRENPPVEHAKSSDTVESDLQELATPQGKVDDFSGMSPGGPCFLDSEPMKRLVKRGGVIQARLLKELNDPRIQNEVALILAQIGDQDALPHLIDSLPTTDKLTDEEHFSTTCRLYALWHLTGMPLGIRSKFSPAWTSRFRTRWRNWYESNKDYLYSTPGTSNTPSRWDRSRVALDLEAKLVRQPTSAYRREHPWIAYEEIKTWRDDPAYERKLKEFCFSLLLSPTDTAAGYVSRQAIRSLAVIRDPRALTALHAMCALVDDPADVHDLIWTLKDKGDPSSISVIERLPRSKDIESERKFYASDRIHAIERIRLLEKYGAELNGKPLDIGQQTLFMKCLDGRTGVDELIANLRNREHDCFLSRYLRVAGYVDREPVRACLKQMASDNTRDERARTLVHGALAQLGEKDSLDHLERSLSHKQPGVRLAAAESLWHLGNRDGFNALLGILDTRPIETGNEGVETGGDVLIKVTALRDTNVEFIRAACGLLGEMGDRSAIEPLKRLTRLNLNGVSGGGGSGTGWSGRPDVVALAKLGDYSGIEVLRASIRKGDPLSVVGSWGDRGGGDLVEIGLKRFIPELLPMLDQRKEENRILAARDVLMLLEQGK